jgi:crotonobetainyl-CoA:carnitine CoA-transferase CaiB-like acyl-CoA transferase
MKQLVQPVLKGLRILDFSWVLAGPYATRILADFGAEVIKIQPLLPESADTFSRGYYNTWNRNKLGITLNMEKTQGVEIACKLVALCDAVVENFSPRVMDNWGLDYPALQLIRPDIIYLRMSAAGHSGARQNYSGFGPTVQAASGLTGLTGYEGEAPLGIGFSIADHIAGLYGAIALLGALEFRNKTGRGQYIDLSQTETLSLLLADPVLEYTKQTRIDLNNHPVPQGIYRCQGENRWVAITINSDTEWNNFKKVLEQPNWAEQPEFSTKTSRLQNSGPLDTYIQAWTLTHSPFEVITLLQHHNIASGVVQNTADLACDPQLKSRSFFFEQFPSSPIRLSQSSAAYRKTAPLKSADNDYVYRGLLGFSSARMDRLKRDNVI